MEELQLIDTGNMRRTMQQISVPFLWEEKPGMLNKEWTPNSLSIATLSPPPMAAPPPPELPPIHAKFVVSVPFKWEEKPGTPLRSSLAAEDKSLPLPPTYSRFFECFESDQESSFGDDNEDNDPEEPDWLMELDQETECTSSPNSLESGSSPVGNSLLEQLFPLYSPKAYSPGKLVASSNLEISGCTEGVVASSSEDKANDTQLKGLRGEGESSIVIRRPSSLGELIMLSQRRSYLQKAIRMRKKSVSKEIEEPKMALDCSMFGAGEGGITKLFRGK